MENGDVYTCIHKRKLNNYVGHDAINMEGTKLLQTCLSFPPHFERLFLFCQINLLFVFLYCAKKATYRNTNEGRYVRSFHLPFTQKEYREVERIKAERRRRFSKGDHTQMQKAYTHN